MSRLRILFAILHRSKLSSSLLILLPLLTHCRMEAEKFPGDSQPFLQPVPAGAVLKYDFLWVLDNTRSMEDKNAALSDQITAFLHTAGSGGELDYRMAVTTTDYFQNHGELVATANGLNLVDSQNSEDPVGDFRAIVSAIDYGSASSLWEQGLESAYQVLSKQGARFSRPGVPLVVVFLSDEDDYSCADGCEGPPPERNGTYVRYALARYSEYFKSLERSGKAVWIFPLVRTPSGSCEEGLMGIRYLNLLTSIGKGTEASVCDEDLENSFQQIAQALGRRS